MNRIHPRLIVLTVLLLASALVGANCFGATVAVIPGMSIQDAVDGVDPGDTILVGAGNYTENITIAKSLTLRSPTGADTTFIEAADTSQPVIQVTTTSHVTIEGLSLHGAINSRGIYCYQSNNVSISNNRCGYDGTHYNLFGIVLDGCNNCLIGDNQTYGYNLGAGIYISGSAGSHWIADNSIAHSDRGIHLDNSDGNLILDNHISNCNYGIYMTTSDNNRIRQNHLFLNTTGIFLQAGSQQNLFVRNTATNATHTLYINFSDNNRFVLNNFISNASPADQIYSQGSVNHWRSPAQLWYEYGSDLVYNGHAGFLGNHYDDHDLSDDNNDGVTNLVYNLPGDESWDWNPLAEPHVAFDMAINCYLPAEIGPADEQAILDSLTIYQGPLTSGLLTIGGRLNLGPF